MLKRFVTDFTVTSKQELGDGFVLMKLKHPDHLPDINAGQFVEIKVPDTSGTFLRRPISIHDVNYDDNTISLLFKVVGNGTMVLSNVGLNEQVSMVYPLGNGFNVNDCGNRPLLVGGGVGVAPLYYLGKRLKESGANVEFLIGARNAAGLLLQDEYKGIGVVNVTTEDGSVGTKGFVTDHECLKSKLAAYTSILVCGPTPMMKAVGKVAESNGISCKVSLENKMACGIGVCLCCVTDTKEGHKCVCSEGPVFDIKDLKW